MPTVEDIWNSLTFGQIVTVIVLLIIIFVVIVSFVQNPQMFTWTNFRTWFEEAGKVNMARGLITFLVVFTTISIALILVISLFFGNFQNRKEQFMLGKEILTVFIGILGTIMGFYYGEGTVAVERIEELKNAVQSEESRVNENSIVELEKKAFKALIEKNFDSAFDFFSSAYQIKPTWRNIDEIRKILNSKKDSFKTADNVQKDRLWKEIYCQMDNEKKLLGMPSEILKQFKNEVKTLECQTVSGVD